MHSVLVKWCALREANLVQRSGLRSHGVQGLPASISVLTGCLEAGAREPCDSDHFASDLRCQ